MLVYIMILEGLATVAAKRRGCDNSNDKRERKIASCRDQERYSTSRSLLLFTVLVHISSSYVVPTRAQRNVVFAQNPGRNFTGKGGRSPDVSGPGVQLNIQDNYVVMSNGILEVTLSNPDGIVTGIKYNGIDNLLEVRTGENNRGYWDLVWDKQGAPRTKGKFDRMECTNFSVIVENEDQVELSFTRNWDPSQQDTVVPLNIDKRFVMLRGSSGFYTYGIYEHLEEWPGFNIDNTRVVFKLNKDKFNYMVIADDRQRYMPLPEDRSAERSRVLAYPEAVLLVDPVEPEFKGEVDDKYQYSCENQHNKVHGWICLDPAVGFWQITPSSEFRSGGPLKQGLASHVGPTNLAIFHSAHYSGADMVLRFGPNEAWKKVFGPIFMYVNSLSDENDDQLWLWEDAKQQMKIEEQSWPYTFPASEDFPPSVQRGTVSGRLLVLDSDEYLHIEGAYVGLAPPGEAGSWQTECKGYQFWTTTDENGYFTINNIRAGDYNLFASVPGFIGDYKFDKNIAISPGCEIELGNITYEPPRDGPTLWEIGVPDRSAAEFYVPDPNPMYINHLYVSHPDKYRQYGLWERYADLYPHEDLVYNVDDGDYTTDWFFAQVTRKVGNNTYQGSTWQIKFTLDNVDRNGTYKLWLALATANSAKLEVRVNDPTLTNPPLFSSGVIGKDNTIARHGIHGLYRLFLVDIPGKELVQGNNNTIFLTQLQCTGPFEGIMNLISPNNTDHEFNFTIDSGGKEGVPVQVHVRDNYVVMGNGIVQVTLLNPSGFVAAIKYKGIDNLLEAGVKEDKRGYWDMVWSQGGGPSGKFDMLGCTSFEIIMANEEQVELSFTMKWNPSQVGIVVPLNIDKRFVMLRGSSGFYTYAIYEHLPEWPAFSIGETRVAFRLRKDKFNYMAISNERQRYMPLPDDRLIPQRAQPLAYKEAVLLVNPVEPQFRGEVDDKYQYSSEHKDQKVHGWISEDLSVGFWQITPSNEFRSGGPMKQDLTSHVGPTNLAVFHSTHYCGEEMGLNVGPNEAWKKVLGPIFIYLNSFSDDSHETSPNSRLWQDANIQMGIEEESWPYNFPVSADFFKYDQRGEVRGRLQVRDSSIGDESLYPKGAYVGLAAPGDYGSWQTESKGYQFWSRTNHDGYFYISNVRAGDYNLYAWVPDFIGDYKYNTDLAIGPGSMTDLGEIVYQPPRDGPTLWEIGIPDRSAAEFYIPEPNPMYFNKLYVDRPHDRFRQYGLWDRYRDLYPVEDLVYTVGTSDYKKDWFYAQVTRWKDETSTLIGTTWQIKFSLDDVNLIGTYKLLLALASVTHSELQVRVNDPNIANPPLFSSGYFGRDNSIARHGIHGLYRLFFVDVAGNRLVQGSNTIFLTQPRCTSPFEGIMYDYIRLEAPI